MSPENEQLKGSEGTAPKEGTLHEDTSRADWFLQNLIRRADLGTSMSIVLNVGG